MKTLMLSSDDNDIKKAAEIIKNGGLVAMPTETVYGLAADAFNPAAVSNIFKAKGRPMDNPLIIHISDISQIYRIVRSFPPSAKKLAELFWPGAITMILPRSDEVPYEVCAGLDTVAVRFPSNTVANKLISNSAPLAAPSANLSGKPSPTNAKHVFEDMNGRIDAIIDGGECEVGVESTVITLTGKVPVLLRPGDITAEQLKEVLGEIIIDDAVTNPLKDNEKATSPGMKYKHYAPAAELILLDGEQEKFLNYVNKNSSDGVMALCYDEDIKNLDIPYISIGKENDYQEHEHRLFTALRKCDERGAKIVYAHCPQKTGTSLAIYNRIIRAAAFRVISL